MAKAFFGLPEEVMFCKHCVISNQRPSSTVEFKHKQNEKKATIGFDKDGVCDACRFVSFPTRGPALRWSIKGPSRKPLASAIKAYAWAT